MEEESRAGQSVFLRGWGEYQPYSLKLTESSDLRPRHMALRAYSADALTRRVAAIEATGLGDGWIDGDHGHGPAYRFRDPDGHVFEVFGSPTATRRPSTSTRPAQPAAALHGARRRGQAPRPRQPARADVAACRRFATDVLGYRHYEGIVLDDGRRPAPGSASRSPRTS